MTDFVWRFVFPYTTEKPRYLTFLGFKEDSAMKEERESLKERIAELEKEVARLKGAVEALERVVALLARSGSPVVIDHPPYWPPITWVMEKPRVEYSDSSTPTSYFYPSSSDDYITLTAKEISSII